MNISLVHWAKSMVQQKKSGLCGGPQNCAVPLVLLACFAIVFCSGCSSKSKPDPSQIHAKSKPDPPIIQPHGNGEVAVQFTGLAATRTATLYRVQANKIQEFQTLETTANEGSVRIELDSGFYMVGFDGESTKVPVPALQPFLKTDLVVSLDKFPTADKSWCWIPSGPSIMGDTLGVGREDERPAKIVNVEGFWMAANEVTNRQYAEFLSDRFSGGEAMPENWIDIRSRKCRIKKNEEGSFESDAGQLPVVMVSLAGAQAYCQWISEKTNNACRLPTESEWEKAARGPELFVYSYGNIYKQSLANQESGKLKPVGTYAPNSYGLYDMTGNVFEWMSGVADPAKSETTLNHSLRGGSFVLDGMYLRNSFKMKQSPSVMTDDIGFRMVRDPLP